MCEVAKAKGVVRPNINSVPKKLRGRRGLRGRRDRQVG